MKMNPPTPPLEWVPVVYSDELIRALELIKHATAPTHEDGAYHEAVHDIADAILKRVAERKAYDAMEKPA